MDIKRDEIWITRGGEEVRIICTDVCTFEPIVGVTKEGNIQSYKKDGRYYKNAGSEYDLIHKKPAIKQIKLEAWITPSGRLERYSVPIDFPGWTRVLNLDLVAEVEE